MQMNKHNQKNQNNSRTKSNQKGNRNNRNRNRNRNRSNQKGQTNYPTKSTPADKLVKTYYVQIEKLQIARRKYYDDFHHQDPNRVKKLRKNFERSVEELRTWESKLTEEQAQLILSERNEIDLTYSSIHKLSPIGINEVSEEQVLDPHFKKQQQEAISEYKDDDEETVGTMSDYRSYKGI